MQIAGATNVTSNSFYVTLALHLKTLRKFFVSTTVIDDYDFQSQQSERFPSITKFKVEDHIILDVLTHYQVSMLKSLNESQ